MHRRSSGRPPGSSARLVFVITAALLSGCGTVPADSDADVAEVLRARDVEVPSRASARRPVPDVIDAVEARALALERNARVRAWLAELDVAAADLAQAARVADPVFDLGALSSDADGAGLRVLGGAAFSLTSLLTRDIRLRRARDGLDALEEEVAGRVVEFLASVSAAHVKLVLARQRLDVRALAADAARTSVALGERWDAAGNFSEYELADVRSMAAAVEAEYLEAGAALVEARVHFADLVGLDVDDDWDVPATLPTLPDALPGGDGLRTVALDVRLELVAQRTRVLAAARTLPEIERQRWLEGIDLGVEFEREPDDERLVGPLISWSPGILDDRGPRLAAQRGRLAGLEAELAQRELEVANAVTAQLRLLAIAREREALVRTGLVAARAERVRVLQQEVNFMLADVFELLEARREEYASWEDRAEALADHWMAWTDLERVTGMRIAPPETPPFDPLGHDALDHGAMDHGAMDHDAMNQGAMDHGAMNHGAMDHDAMDHDAMDHDVMEHDAMDHDVMEHDAMDHGAGAAPTHQGDHP